MRSTPDFQSASSAADGPQSKLRKSRGSGWWVVPSANGVLNDNSGELILFAGFWRICGRIDCEDPVLLTTKLFRLLHPGMWNLKKLMEVVFSLLESRSPQERGGSQSATHLVFEVSLNSERQSCLNQREGIPSHVLANVTATIRFSRSSLPSAHNAARLLLLT